jgi:fumarate reductase subunit D
MKTSIAPSKITIALIVGTVVILASTAALNGGVALAASSFDGIVTTIKGMLSSTMVLTFALVALFAALWQITHGKGYGMLGMVLGVMAIGILGPAIVTSVSTTTRHPAAMIVTSQAVIIDATVAKSPTL